MVIFLLYVEVHCTPITALTNVFISNENTTVGSVVYASCEKSQRFIDGTSAKLISCLNNGSWNDVISNCAGMNVFENIPHLACNLLNSYVFVYLLRLIIFFHVLLRLAGSKCVHYVIYVTVLC